MQLKKHLFALVIIITPLLCNAQSRAGFWYFGEKAGLEFKNDNTVVILKDGALSTNEGCATICDKKGDLLFYTDGRFVYNKEHKQMEGGKGLNGNKSATQSSIIVPKPGSTILYYIFTVDAHENFLDKAHYAIVDMSKNNGLGAVIEKNIELTDSKVCEKITAVKHENGVDYWVIFHLWNSDIFSAFLLTKDGIGTKKVNTPIGTVYKYDEQHGGQDGAAAAIGYMKVSPEGNKLAAVSYTTNTVELFDFNNNTGRISNIKKIKGVRTPYGLEFSPSGNLLYISSFKDRSVYQYNIKNGTLTNIIWDTWGGYGGALQIAPNGKIYVARNGSAISPDGETLDVIENPDGEGESCNYITKGQKLGGRYCGLGLPNFVNSIFALTFDYHTDCSGLDVDFEITSSLENIKSAFWIFGDKSKGEWGDINNSFKVNHTYEKPGTYTVKLKVELISGGVEEIEQEIQTMELPVAKDVNPVVWEDPKGSGEADVNLEELQQQINGGEGIVYKWFSDKELKNEVVKLNPVRVKNGQQFWVLVSNGECENTALVTYTVKSLPIYKDIEDSACEDVYGSGKRKVDLESKKHPDWGDVKVTWYKDEQLTNLVQHPESVVVSQGDVYYAKIVAKDGVVSTAKITFTVYPLPKGNDIIVKVWEDPFGSGTAQHINLRTYDESVTDKGIAVDWYDKDGNKLTNVSDLTVKEGDIFYAKMKNEHCENSGSVQFFIRSAPVVVDLTVAICENETDEVDLTQWNKKINKEEGSTFKWYFDKDLKKEVPDPKKVKVNKGDKFYVKVTLKGESSVAELAFNVLPLPQGVEQTIVVFKGKTDKNVDLTAYDNAVSNDSGYPVEWYRDEALTDKIDNPKSVDVKEGDIFYAKISNGSCYNSVKVTVVVKATPVANDIVEIRCSNINGDTVYDDLTKLQEKINGDAGDEIKWYSSWPQKPKGMPTNPVSDPTKVEVIDGKEYYAIVTDKNDATSTNYATVTYQLKDLPVANKLIKEIWESTMGTGEAVGINLEDYNKEITDSENKLVWLNGNKDTILTPQNVKAVNDTIFYARIENDFGCSSEGSITFKVKELPKTHDLIIDLCEIVQDKAQITLDDQLKKEISTEMENGKWYKKNEELKNDTTIWVTSQDTIVLKGKYNSNDISGKITFKVNPTPVFKAIAPVEVCEDVSDSGTKNGIDLTVFESEITETTGVTFVWYTDKEYHNAVKNPKSVAVHDRTKFYVLLSLGDCSAKGEILFRVDRKPKYEPYSEEFCSETDKKNSVHINLSDYNHLVPDVSTVEWFNDFDLTDPIKTLNNIEVVDRAAFYAKIAQKPCEGRFRLNIVAKPLPKAKIDTISACEDSKGLRAVDAYNLNSLNLIIFNNEDRVEWYRDETFAESSKIVNPESYKITDGTKLYVKIDGVNGCSNSQAINFKVHDLPQVDLGKDTTIYYAESKEFKPDIPKKYLPGKYLWQDKSTKPTLVATKQGKYKLIFTDKNGCVAADSTWLFVDDYRMFVPNAFTPNGDGRNDTFAPIISGDLGGKKIEMYIYNRWGELVYEFTDIGQGKNKGGTPWDGTYKGKPAKVGVYIWLFVVDGKSRKNGTITLIR